MSSLILNFNASRTSSLIKIRNFINFINQYDPIFVAIQEINIASALQIFSEKFQVLVNIEESSKDGIGIVSLVKKDIHIVDTIVGVNGRIIGIKIKNAQFWNIYPQSGTNFKNRREIFFREELTGYMMNWKDHTRYIFQLGDHNCVHRALDSLHNSNQHIQPALIKHMQIHGLKDDFISVHGNDVLMYSRITNISSTRIDYILSNSNACSYFQYVDMLAGLDHKVAIAKYEISIEICKEYIPKDRYFSGWVISKRLENDQIFLEQARFVFRTIMEEVEVDARQLDPSFYWLKAKHAIVNLAKSREKKLDLGRIY